MGGWKANFNVILQAQFDLCLGLTGLGSSRIGLGLVWGLTWALGSTITYLPEIVGNCVTRNHIL